MIRPLLDSTRDTFYPMREPCRYCTHAFGTLMASGPHHKINCAQCGRFAYFAPKSEVERIIQRGR